MKLSLDDDARFEKKCDGDKCAIQVPNLKWLDRLLEWGGNQ